MAETAMFGLFTAAIVYLMYWLWKNDEENHRRKTPFSPGGQAGDKDKS